MKKNIKETISKIINGTDEESELALEEFKSSLSETPLSIEEAKRIVLLGFAECFSPDEPASTKQSAKECKQ